MPRIWVIPGLLESRLTYDPAGKNEMWASLGELGRGAVGALRLAPDGVSPGPPDGKQLYARGTLATIWALWLTTLQSQMAPFGYSVLVYSYDWRLRLDQTGDQLAADFLGEEIGNTGVVVIGHSLGGLLTRYLWYKLGLTGQQSIVRRIITIGTPHQGSYAPVEFWSGYGSQVDQLLLLNQQVTGSISPFAPPGTVQRFSRADLELITQTWPSLYDLMPSLGGTWAMSDPERIRLYDAANWPLVDDISQRHLSHSATVWGPLMLNAASMPPPWVLTTVSGVGHGTIGALTDAQAIGQGGSLGDIIDGDGTVPRISADIPDSARAWYIALHTDLKGAVQANGGLRDLILDERSAPSPPPPLIQDPVLYPRTLIPPPIPYIVGASSAGGNCQDGNCSC